MTLKSLEEHNKIVRRRDRARKAPRPNGIACPDCGFELDDLPGIQFTSDPPQIPVRCECCGWKGMRL